MEHRRNPYSTVLMVFALLGLVGGGALLVIAGLASTDNAAAQLLLTSIGLVSLGIGALFFILWLAVSAIAWAIFAAATRS